MKYDIEYQYCLSRFFTVTLIVTPFLNLLSYFSSYIESVFLLGSLEFSLPFLFNTTISSIYFRCLAIYSFFVIWFHLNHPFVICFCCGLFFLWFLFFFSFPTSHWFPFHGFLFVFSISSLTIILCGLFLWFLDLFLALLLYILFLYM